MMMGMKLSCSSSITNSILSGYSSTFLFFCSSSLQHDKHPGSTFNRNLAVGGGQGVRSLKLLWQDGSEHTTGQGKMGTDGGFMEDL